jgi:carboxymethylenebutenolidase
VGGEATRHQDRRSAAVAPHRDGRPRFRCPVLALYGGADAGIPPEATAEFDQALARAGVAHESHTYEGAPHSFFDRKQAEFAEQSADAWRRVQAFVRAHTPAP